MVLKRKHSTRSIVDLWPVTSLRKVLIVPLACLAVVGCRGTHADQAPDNSKCQVPGVELDERQLIYVVDSLQKRFQWRAYWTFNDDASKSAYNAQARRRFSAEIFSLNRGVIVHIPDLGNTVVAFRKTTDGSISNPDFVMSGPALKADFTGDKVLAMADALGNSTEFLLLAGIEVGRELDQRAPRKPNEDMKSYIEENRKSIKYCQTETEISLLPLTVPSYQPMDERKQAILNAIVDESFKQANRMFTRGETITMTWPNFNANDTRIWFLLEEGDGEAYTMGLSMNVLNADVSVTHDGTVEIRSNPRYGIRIGADEKIKRGAIKTLRYTIP